MEAPGEKLLIKLWETLTERGIGALLAPWQMRRIAKASAEIRREELLIIAQAEKEADMIRRGETSLFSDRHGNLLIRHEKSSTVDSASSSTISFYTERAPTRTVEMMASDQLVAETLRREANIARALLHAEDALKEETEAPSQNKVDDDWLYRWRDSASQVSNEQLQLLWGRILAGEVKAPGSISLRTMEFLRNLSQREAQQISMLAPYVLGNVVFSEASDLLSAAGLSFNVLLELQYLGVLGGVESRDWAIQWKSKRPDAFVASLKCHSRLLVITSDDPDRKLTCPVYQLTPIGEQVVGLGGPFEADENYLRKVGAHFKEQQFNVFLAKCIEGESKKVVAFDEELL
jgi:hypothetical protein